MTTAHQFPNAASDAVTFTPATIMSTPSTPSSVFTNSPALSSSSTVTTMTPDTPTEQQSIDDIPDSKHTHESAYVHSLVDMTVHTIDSIWTAPPAIHGTPSSNARTVDTRTFVKTLLQLSRTRHSTLLIAIFYLFRIKPRLQKSLAFSSVEDRRYLICGRRMFLVSLLLACKYQNDVTPKNSVWARASGLPVAQINHAERLFLGLLDYQLFISKESYEQWTTLVERHCQRYTVSSNISTNTNSKRTATVTPPPSLPLASQENRQQSFMQSSCSSSDHMKKRRVLTKNGYDYASETGAMTHLPSPPPTESNGFMDPSSSKRKWSTV